MHVPFARGAIGEEISFGEIAKGDFVNLQAVATHRDGDTLTVRIAGAHGVAQFNVRAERVVGAVRGEPDNAIEELSAGYNMRLK